MIKNNQDEQIARDLVFLLHVIGVIEAHDELAFSLLISHKVSGTVYLDQNDNPLKLDFDGMSEQLRVLLNRVPS